MALPDPARDIPTAAAGVRAPDTPNPTPHKPPTALTLTDPGEPPGSGETPVAPPPPPAPAPPTTPTLTATGPAVPGFEIISELGRGGMGVVYKARQVNLQRVVALKLLLGEGKVDNRPMIRFLAEAEALAAVQHPNVVGVYQYGQHDGRPYLAMEYVPGGTVADLLDDRPALPPEEAAGLIELTARGVAAAHDAGIVHRDLKPGNVLLWKDSATAEHKALGASSVHKSLGSRTHAALRDPAALHFPKVTDFGLAKRMVGSKLTRTGAIMGTPAYMAPEQTGGKKFVGPPADVWALGVMLYECLTGTRPFDGEDMNGTFARIITDDPVRPRVLAPGVPRDLELICLKCLEKEAKDRYPTARELTDDLRRFLNGDPVSVRAAGAVEIAYKWVRRRPWVAGLGAALAASLAAGTVASWVLAAEAKQSESRANRNADALKIALGQAQASEHRANEYADRAQKRDIQARRALARLAATEGVRRADEGDGKTGLLLLTEGLFLFPDLDPETERVGRVRYATFTRYANGRPGGALGHTDNVHAAAVSADGKLFATAGHDKVAKVWDATTLKPRTYPGADDEPADGLSHGGRVMAVSFSPDGTLLATASLDGKARVWDVRTGKLLVAIPHAGEVGVAVFSPDGKHVVTGDASGVARVWDAATGDPTSAEMRHAKDQQIVAAVFSRDGTRVATCARDQVARVWDAATGDPVTPPLKHAGPVEGVAFSPTGDRLATATTANAAHVWDAATGAEVLKIEHTGEVLGVAFDHTGNRLVTAGGDMAARVLNARTGELLAPLMRHTSSVLAATFSPDGKWVLTTSDDTSARVWDAATGQPITPALKHPSPVFTGLFAPGGLRAVTVGGPDARVWDLSPTTEPIPDLLRKARQDTGQRLGPNGELIDDVPPPAAPPPAAPAGMGAVSPGRGEVAGGVGLALAGGDRQPRGVRADDPGRVQDLADVIRRVRRPA